MKGIWQQFRSDLRRVTSNVMAVIVLFGSRSKEDA